MGTIERFQDLKIWQEARIIHQVVLKLIRTTNLGKDYKLKDQMSDSSGSSMDNIAEGFGRDGHNEFIQFLSIAKGSTTELQSQFYRCEDANYITATECSAIQERLQIQVSKISRLMAYLKYSPIKGIKFKNREPNGKQKITNNEPDLP